MVRPFNNQVLVKLDERPKEEKVGTIFVLPGAVERVWTGTVVALGQGRWSTRLERWVPISHLHVGMRIAFFRENFETQQGKQVAHILGNVLPGHGLLPADAALGEVI